MSSSWRAPEDQPIVHPPPQTVFRKPMLDFSPELYSAPSWEDQYTNSTKKRPPSTAGSVPKKRGTPARRANTTTATANTNSNSNIGWSSEWKAPPATAIKQTITNACGAAADSDTSADSGTFRFPSFPASLPRISLPHSHNSLNNDSIMRGGGVDESSTSSSFSLFMATPRAKLNFALGMSNSESQSQQDDQQHLFAPLPQQFQQPSFVSASTAAGDVSEYTKNSSRADATESTAPLTPNRHSAAASSDCPDTPHEVQLHFTDLACSPIASVPAIPEEKSGSSASSRPLPDMNAFGDVNSSSSSSSSEPRRLCPPTPIRTPAWAAAAGRICYPDHSLLETKLLAGDSSGDDNYKVVATLGRGNFADVYKIKTSDGKSFALKYHRRPFRGHRDRTAAIKEVQVMERLQQHPNVLQLHRAWQCDGHFLLQTELCCRATCRDLLDCHSDDGGLPMDVVAKIGYDIANGLDYVHTAGFVHNDIKPSNILFHPETADCKIGDFGMAVSTTDQDCFVEGDQRYMAPEVLRDSASQPASDIFSLGLTLYEASTGTLIPSEGARWHALRDGSTHFYPPTKDATAEQRLITSMLQQPTGRPTASVVCEQLRQARGSPPQQLRDFVRAAFEAEAVEEPQQPAVLLLQSPPETGRLL